MSNSQDPPLISKPASTTHTKSQRLPAPTLFVGPQSLNASQVSVNRHATPDPTSSSQANDRPTAGAGAGVGSNANTNKGLKPPSTLRYPLERTRSGLTYRTPHPHQLTTTETKTSVSIDGRVADAARGPDGTSDQLQIPSSLRKPSDRSLDAKWREMQAALNEVELTAQSTTQIFGTRHAAALDELRRAQIELARAWDRGDDDRTTETAEREVVSEEAAQHEKSDARAATTGRAHKSRARAATNQSASTALSGESGFSGASYDSASTMPERDHEAAHDIRLGTERRTANEAYFRTVDRGVKDVVAKLQHVAEAMKQVESESRSLWSESSTEAAEAS